MEATRVASTAGRRGDDVHMAARLGDVPALRHILRADPERVHEKGSFGRLASKNCCFLLRGGWWVWLSSVPEEIQDSQVWC